MAKWLRRAFLVLLGLAILGGIVYALWPKPVPVEVATAERGPMRVTVDEDGNTRIRERYVISAPLSGRLSRITLEEGDPVVADETIVAAIEPTDPALLDPRARAEAEARVRAAEAAVDLAGAAVTRANTALELAQAELERLEQAAASGATTAIELDRARAEEAIRHEQAREALFAREVAEFELELARAALLRGGDDDAEGWRMEIRAPVDGRVLRVFQESAAVVTPGTPLIEIGDPADLELVIDVLSRDAVAINPGAPASLEQWGGDAPLEGRVRLVEPAAFTKISALGVEEQRVNVIIDFAGPPEERAGLGDGFRIEARITVWDEPSVLNVPTGALFRQAESWAVFAIEDGRAELTRVQVGHRNGAQAEILGGLEEGDVVVVYPSDRVRDGVRVVRRGS